MSESVNGELYMKKYGVALKLLNKILENIGGEPIDDIIQFKKIDRNDLIKPENRQTVEDMEGEIFEVFDKSKCGYYKKATIQQYQTSMIRGMCKELGFSLISNRRELWRKIDGLNVRVPYIFYSIIKE